MRIVVDARTLVGNRSGVGYYLTNLIEHGTFDGTEVIAYYACDADRPRLSVPESTSLEWRQLRPPSVIQRILGTAWPLWWLNVEVTRAIQRDNVDVFFGPNFVQPITSDCPSVVVVHDMIHRTFPQAHPSSYRWYLRFSLAGALRCADHVLTVSESSQRDILRYHENVTGRISIAPGAASDRYRPRELESSTVSTLQKKYGLPDRFLLSVGTIEPRKNLVAVTNALRRIPPAERPPFVVIGERRDAESDFTRTVRNGPLDTDVYFTGYVDDTDLPLIYNMSDIFVFPSLYEGFGLPVLEAMQSGTPVVVSNRSSLPGIVGQSGVIVNPDDSEAFADVLRKLWSNPDLRAEYSEKGIERARRFSWDRTAETVSNVLSEVSRR